MRALIYGDTHVPFESPSALEVVAKLTKDARPDVLVHIGDLVDCWSISRFSKDPLRKDDLQDNIDQAARHLRRMTKLAPDAAKVYIEGNHEQRLARVISGMKEEQKELARLRVFQDGVTWPAILAEAGVPEWRYVPTRRQASARVLPNLVVKHGSVVRRWSGQTAKAEWERYGHSGISGHTHRLGLFYHNDMNGAHGWSETGCTCDLKPEYVEDPDWQHGCVIVTYAGSRFNFEPVYIQKGVALWREKEIRV